MRLAAIPIGSRIAILIASSVVLILVGCGSSGGGSSSSTQTSASSGSGGKPSCGSATNPASSEAASAAQGDIPDNQQFLTFHNPSGGYSIKYPEGWARSGGGADVSFQDKSNTITARVITGPKPTVASVGTALKRQGSGDPCLKAGTPQSTTVGPNKVVKVTYTTKGQASQVTGQRPKISVDRYVYFKQGKIATLDLGNPVGVDNVDAYRMISESFRWG
jgi:hypothetical protein